MKLFKVFSLVSLLLSLSFNTWANAPIKSQTFNQVKQDLWLSGVNLPVYSRLGEQVEQPEVEENAKAELPEEIIQPLRRYFR